MRFAYLGISRRGTCCEGIVECCFEFRCFLCLLYRRILRAKTCSDGDIVCTVSFVLTGFGIRYSMPGLYVRRLVLTATLFALLFSYWLLVADFGFRDYDTDAVRAFLLMFLVGITSVSEGSTVLVVPNVLFEYFCVCSLSSSNAVANVSHENHYS